MDDEDQTDELLLETEEPEEIEADEAPEDEAPEEDLTIEIDGEEAEEDEPPLAKGLRAEIRDRDRELATYRKAAAPKIEVGEKPTLEKCEWDEERFEAELDAWKDRKSQAERAEGEQQQIAQQRNQEYERKTATFRARAAALPVRDWDEAEATVSSALSPEHAAMLIMYADQPEKVGYALYKHPAKLAALSQESDPFRFLIAIKDIERNLKVTTRRKPPAPEASTVTRGSASLSANSDKKLAQLEKDAERTGNRTEVIAYKAKMKERGNA